MIGLLNARKDFVQPQGLEFSNLHSLPHEYEAVLVPPLEELWPQLQFAASGRFVRSFWSPSAPHVQ